mgnify:CR=1 FL=1
MMKIVHVRVWRGLAVMLALLVLPLAPALAFVDPPTFSPAQPYAGQSIEMSVRVGQCHGFAMPPPLYPFPFMEVQRDDGIIDVLIAGTWEDDLIFCNIPVYTALFDIGEFPEGEYVVRIRIRDVSSPPFILFPFPAAEAPLVVVGVPAPVSIPTFNVGAMIVLVGLIMGVTTLLFRKAAGIFLLVLVPASLMLPHSSLAQDVEKPLILVELSRAQGTPSPENVVNGFDPAGGVPPPIPALAAEYPEAVLYLIPHPYRAAGDFKAYLDANPDLPARH